MLACSSLLPPPLRDSHPGSALGQLPPILVQFLSDMRYTPTLSICHQGCLHLSWVQAKEVKWTRTQAGLSKQPQLGQGRGDQCSPRGLLAITWGSVSQEALMSLNLPCPGSSLHSLQPLPPFQLWLQGRGHSACPGQSYHLLLPTAPSLGCSCSLGIISSHPPSPSPPLPHFQSHLPPQSFSCPSHLLCLDPTQAMVISSLGLCKYLP